MPEVTFRDFAGAIMSKDTVAAGRVLAELLALDDEPAVAAARHFEQQMKTGGPTFMSKAMGLRTAVTTGTDEDVRALLVDCFGLDGPSAETALASLRTRYPRA